MATEEAIKEFQLFGKALAKFATGYMREHPALPSSAVAAKMVQHAALLASLQGLSKESFSEGAALAYQTMCAELDAARG